MDGGGKPPRYETRTHKGTEPQVRRGRVYARRGAALQSHLGRTRSRGRARNRDLPGRPRGWQD